MKEFPWLTVAGYNRSFSGSPRKTQVASHMTTTVKSKGRIYTYLFVFSWFSMLSKNRSSA